MLLLTVTAIAVYPATITTTEIIAATNNAIIAIATSIVTNASGATTVNSATTASTATSATYAASAITALNVIDSILTFTALGISTIHTSIIIFIM
jgi:hypothetical protein